jgi:hypothetical protein
VKRLVKVVRLLLAALVLGWVLWRLQADWNGLQLPEQGLSWGYGGLAALSGAASLLLLAALCAGGVRAAGLYRGEHRLAYLRMWLQSLFWRYVPGKVLLVAERIRLGGLLGIPRATSVLLIVWETLLLLAGATLVGLLALPLVAPVSPVALGVLALVLAAMLLGFPRALREAVKRFSWLASRVPHLALDVAPISQLALVGGYVVVWGLLAASFVCTCRFMGADAGVEAGLWFVVAYVAGVVVGVTPAGIGVREGVLAAGLAQTLGSEEALAFAVVNRLVMTGVELVVIAGATLVPLPDEAMAE